MGMRAVVNSEESEMKEWNAAVLEKLITPYSGMGKAADGFRLSTTVCRRISLFLDGTHCEHSVAASVSAGCAYGY